MKIFKKKCKIKNVENADFKRLKMDFSEDNGTYFQNKYFIWGIKSRDDLWPTTNKANLYTMNDIDLIYDAKDNLFKLGIETAYCFSAIADRNNYLLRLLREFEKFVKDLNLPIERYNFGFSNCSLKMTSESISELLANFRVFVKGIIYEEVEV